MVFLSYCFGLLDRGRAANYAALVSSRAQRKQSNILCVVLS